MKWWLTKNMLRGKVEANHGSRSVRGHKTLRKWKKNRGAVKAGDKDVEGQTKAS